MSSYLNFYLTKDESDEGRILLLSYSRSSDIYEMFQDTFGYSTEFRKLSDSDLTSMLHEVQEELYKLQIIQTSLSFIKRDDVINYLEAHKNLVYKAGLIHFLLDTLDTITYNKDLNTIQFNFD